MGAEAYPGIPEGYVRVDTLVEPYAQIAENAFAQFLEETANPSHSWRSFCTSKPVQE